jgi:hypothetical protein
MWGNYVNFLVFVMGKLCAFFGLNFGDYVYFLVFIVGKLCTFSGLYCGEIMCIFWSLLWGKYAHL